MAEFAVNDAGVPALPLVEANTLPPPRGGFDAAAPSWRAERVTLDLDVRGGAAALQRQFERVRDAIVAHAPAAEWNEMDCCLRYFLGFPNSTHRCFIRE